MWSNSDFKTWIGAVNALSLSQDVLKEEAIKFSPVFADLDKKTVLKRVEDFLKMEKKILTQASMLIFKEEGGSEGKMRGRNDVPPKTFFPKAFKMSQLRCDVCDFNLSDKDELKVHIKSKHEDVIKKEFAKEVLALAPHHKQYCEWSSQVNELAKETHECPKVCTEEHLTVTRNLPSGQNIFETTTTKYVLQKDGTKKKIVVKGQVANITTRKRESESESGDLTEVKRKVSEAERRQANNISDILNHVSGDTENAQASLFAKVIDQTNKKIPGFADQLTRRSKALQEKQKYSAEETAALISGAKVSDNVFTKLRTASNKTFGHNPFASRHKVTAARENILPISREDWEDSEHHLFTQKQGKNARNQKKTTILRVKNLKQYIEKVANSKGNNLKHLNSGDDLEVCLDLDAGGGRVVAEFGILNEKSETQKIHPILIFKGSDIRPNLEIALGSLTEQIRILDKAKVKVAGKQLNIKVFGLFDLCALNTVVGKQGNSATYFCAWTNCRLDHIRNHNNKEHNEKNCKEVVFLSMEDYLKNITHHSVEKLPEKATGKLFGSVVNENIVPLPNPMRYVVPVMHVLMGLGNQLFDELTRVAKSLDDKENRNENKEYKENIETCLADERVEKEEKEDMHANFNLSRMVVINDLERIPLLMMGDEKGAEEIAKRNYSVKNSRQKRMKCDSEMCLIFPVDKDNDWDEMIECINDCKVHHRCEGLVPIEPEDKIPENYVCKTCETKTGNESWLEERLLDAKLNLTVKIGRLEKEITENRMRIEKLEKEDSKCGPRQNILKTSAKNLNINPARYHGGSMEGKSVQEMLTCARDKSFSILKCIDDKPEQMAKFKRGLTTLQQVSDVLKNKKFDQFDDDDLLTIRDICESWGKNWPKDFKHLNLTPKAHALSFVLPKFLEENRTFNKFYAMEEMGESIHAALNDIERKIWFANFFSPTNPNITHILFFLTGVSGIQLTNCGNMWNVMSCATILISL